MNRLYGTTQLFYVVQHLKRLNRTLGDSDIAQGKLVIVEAIY